MKHGRGTKAVAIGSGTLLSSIVECWQLAGAGKIEGIVSESDRSEAQWRDVVRDYGIVLYASPSGNVAELRQIHAACRQEGVAFLPVFILEGFGLAGPLSLPDDDRCWESAWRQLHLSAIEDREKKASQSMDAAELGSLLANVAVLGALQHRAGEPDPMLLGRLFVLDMETGEGDYHAFLPHPLVHRQPAAVRVELNEKAIAICEKEPSPDLLSAFGQLTSEVTGLFQLWEEGDLPQIPLSLCQVKAADPLSDGPADLLPAAIVAGLTHEEARREAGLIGLEAYASRLAEHIGIGLSEESPIEDEVLQETRIVGVGAGEDYAEAACRALGGWLNSEMNRRLDEAEATGLFFREARIEKLDDRHCRFYLEALMTLSDAAPTIGWAELDGFPVAWVGTKAGGFASVGLHETLALRRALEASLLSEQLGHEAKLWKRKPNPMANRRNALPAFESAEPATVACLKAPTFIEQWQAAIRMLERSRLRLQAFDIGRSLLGASSFPVKLVGVALRGGTAE